MAVQRAANRTMGLRFSSASQGCAATPVPISRRRPASRSPGGRGFQFARSLIWVNVRRVTTSDTYTCMTYNAYILALVLLCGILLRGGVPANAADPTATLSPPASQTNAAVPTTQGEAQAKPDAVAGQFAVMCAGCHSLTGAKLNGPELTPATAWPIDQLIGIFAGGGHMCGEDFSKIP